MDTDGGGLATLGIRYKPPTPRAQTPKTIMCLIVVASTRSV
jgi:hypothetical protein